MKNNWIKDSPYRVKNATELKFNVTQTYQDLTRWSVESYNSLVPKNHDFMKLLSDNWQSMGKMPPKWTNKPFFQWNNKNIVEFLDQIKSFSETHFENEKENDVKQLLNLMKRDKNLFQASRLKNISDRLKNNPSSGLEEEPGLLSLISELRNDKVLVDSTFQNYEGFDRLKKISQLMYERVNDASDNNCQTKKYISINLEHEIKTVLNQTDEGTSKLIKNKTTDGLEM